MACGTSGNNPVLVIAEKISGVVPCPFSLWSSRKKPENKGRNSKEINQLWSPQHKKDMDVLG